MRFTILHIALCLFSLDVFSASQSSDTLLEGSLSTPKGCVYAYINRVVRLALDMPETLPPTKEKLKAFLGQEYLSAGEADWSRSLPTIIACLEYLKPLTEKVGVSYLRRNKGITDYIVNLLSGLNTWKQKDIETTSIHIAVLGCDLGFELIEILKVLEKYYKEKWTLKSPINITLVEKNLERKEILDPLLRIVNNGWNDYVKVRCVFYDVAAGDFPEKMDSKPCNIVVACHLLNYFSPVNFSLAMKNIWAITAVNGMFFVANRNCQGVAVSYPLQDASVKAFLPGEVLFCLNPDIRLGTSVHNKYFRDIFPETRGDTCDKTSINWDALDLLLKKDRPDVPLILLNAKGAKESFSVDQVIAGIKAGKICVRSNNRIIPPNFTNLFFPFSYLEKTSQKIQEKSSPELTTAVFTKKRSVQASDPRTSVSQE